VKDFLLLLIHFPCLTVLKGSTFLVAAKAKMTVCERCLGHACPNHKKGNRQHCTACQFLTGRPAGLPGFATNARISIAKERRSKPKPNVSDGSEVKPASPQRVVQPRFARQFLGGRK
jgi:hypothetical protein